IDRNERKPDRAYQAAPHGGNDHRFMARADENNRRAAALRALLAKAPAGGKNTVLITHKPNIIDALGKDWFDVKEGEASIFRPDGGAYKLIARIQMDDWPKMAQAVQ